LEILPADVPEPESLQAVFRHSPRERLGGLPEEARGSAAEHEEACRKGTPIGENAEDPENLGNTVDLIENDEPSEGLECEHRSREPDGILRPFEVE
jgi:hypothetical protein